MGCTPVSAIYRERDHASTLHDLPAHAQRLSDRICQLVWPRIYHLAMHLVRIPRVVLQAPGNLSQIFVQCHLIRFAVVPRLNRR